jgi:hypothetical protein
MSKRKTRPPKTRNWLAVAVHLRSGAGKHQDRRTRRRRERGAQERAAIRDQS